MSNYTQIDIETWGRKAQFEFFKEFDIPFFQLTANVDVTHLKAWCKNNEVSFFFCCLYFSLKAANSIEEFRSRLVDGEVRIYDIINAGTTIIMPDKTFIYAYFPFQPSLNDFLSQSKKALEEQKRKGEFVSHSQPNIIYYSAVPWVSFTGLQHARNIDVTDSIPRIVFGKYFEENEKLKMPLSVEAHHALVDGYHMGMYFETFQKYIDQVDQEPFQ